MTDRVAADLATAGVGSVATAEWASDASNLLVTLWSNLVDVGVIALVSLHKGGGGGGGGEEEEEGGEEVRSEGGGEGGGEKESEGGAAVGVVAPAAPRAAPEVDVAALLKLAAENPQLMKLGMSMLATGKGGGG